MSDPNAWIHDGSPIADPFGYDERAVRFLRGLKHPKSNLPGKAFQLDRWQERIVRRIYGPRHPDGSRIVRTVAMMLPRGNRKTSLGAALALLHTIGPENLPGGECMVAASDRSQARIAYQEAYHIVGTISQLAGKLHMTDSKNRIRNPKTGAFFEAISADARTAHGHTPVFALVDELHAWPKRDLWEAIKSGLVKVAGSLLMVISTAGRGHENVAWEFYDYARKVARGEVDDRAPRLMQGLGRRVDHAGEHFYALQLAHRSCRQDRLDHGTQAFVVDRPGKAAGEPHGGLLEGHDLEAMATTARRRKAGLSHSEATMDDKSGSSRGGHGGFPPSEVALISSLLQKRCRCAWRARNRSAMPVPDVISLRTTNLLRTGLQLHWGSAIRTRNPFGER